MCVDCRSFSMLKQAAINILSSCVVRRLWHILLPVITGVYYVAELQLCKLVVTTALHAIKHFRSDSRFRRRTPCEVHWRGLNKVRCSSKQGRVGGLKSSICFRRSWRPCGLSRSAAAASWLGLWFRIPPGHGWLASCQCCVLSGRGLCDGPIPHPEESYRLRCACMSHCVWSGARITLYSCKG